jgi:hypothetical protein
MKYLLIILGLGLLSAGWVAVQFLARRMKTKNHFDHLNSACGHCTCGGLDGTCSLNEEETALAGQ